MAQVALWVLAAVGVALIGLAVAMRVIPSDALDWHVDPTGVETVDARNAHLASAGTVYRISAPDLARALDAVALETPGASRLAGDPVDLWMTYVVRSRIMGFPDFVSIRVTPEGDDHATLAIYARSRFGRSDFGVNRARVANWLAALRRFER